MRNAPFPYASMQFLTAGALVRPFRASMATAGNYEFRRRQTDLIAFRRPLQWRGRRRQYGLKESAAIGVRCAIRLAKARAPAFLANMRWSLRVIPAKAAYSALICVPA
jgi:hypothetical protein